MRGRLPKPVRLKLIEGNPGKRDLAPQLQHEAQLDLGAQMPGGLTPAAVVEWQRLADEFTRAGLLTSIDARMLVVCVEACAPWRATVDLVGKTGLLVKTGNGSVKLNPALVALRHAEAAMIRTLGEFGCSPSSRSRAQAGGKRTDDDDEVRIDLPRPRNVELLTMPAFGALRRRILNWMLQGQPQPESDNQFGVDAAS